MNKSRGRNSNSARLLRRPGLKRLLAMRYRRLQPWIRSPDHLNEIMPGRLGAFLSTVGWLFCRESTLLIFAFTFAFLLSIFPLIVLMITVTSVAGLESYQETLYTALEHFFPVSAEWIVRNLQIYIEQVGAYHVVSVILLAWGGAALIFSLEASLEIAYRVEVPRNFLSSQILGTLLVVALGLLALGVTAMLHGLTWLFGEVVVIETPYLALFTLNYYILSFLFLICLFACAFHWLPNRDMPFRRVLPEAIFAAILVVIADLVFKSIAPSMDLEEVYGPFHVSITILLWGYTFGLIIVGSARLAANGFFSGNFRATIGDEAPEADDAHGGEEQSGSVSASPHAGSGDD